MILTGYSLIFVLLMMVWHWLCSKPDRQRTGWTIGTILICLPFALVANDLADWIVLRFGAHITWRYDLYVYGYDRLLGEPSFVIGRLVHSSRILTLVTDQVYGSCVGIMIVAFCVYVWLAFDEKFVVVRAFVLNLLCALPVYLMFPVCGPVYAFKDFPHAPGVVTSHIITLRDVPNGVPSIHNSNAMLFAALMWRWKWGRIAGVVFVLATAFTTLGNGQHYFFDILCAVPYTCFVYRLSVVKFRDRPTLVRSDGGGGAAMPDLG